MRRVIFALALLWVSSFPAYAASPSFQTATANVAAWNLSGFSPIPREKAKEFANAILYLDPEALVLVEVNPDFIAAEIVAELMDQGIVAENGPEPNQAGGVGRPRANGLGERLSRLPQDPAQCPLAHRAQRAGHLRRQPAAGAPARHRIYPTQR